MTHTITIIITDAEHKALTRLASREIRTLPEQVRYIVANNLITRQYLTVADLEAPLETPIDFPAQNETGGGNRDDTEQKIQAARLVIKPPKKGLYRGEPSITWQVFQEFKKDPYAAFTRQGLAARLNTEYSKVAGAVTALIKSEHIKVAGNRRTVGGQPEQTLKLTAAALRGINQKPTED